MQSGVLPKMITWPYFSVQKYDEQETICLCIIMKFDSSGRRGKIIFNKKLGSNFCSSIWKVHQITWKRTRQRNGWKAWYLPTIWWDWSWEKDTDKNGAASKTMSEWTTQSMTKSVKRSTLRERRIATVELELVTLDMKWSVHFLCVVCQNCSRRAFRSQACKREIGTV